MNDQSSKYSILKNHEFQWIGDFRRESTVSNDLLGRRAYKQVDNGIRHNVGIVTKVYPDYRSELPRIEISFASGSVISELLHISNVMFNVTNYN